MAIPAATIRSRVKPESSCSSTIGSQVDETLSRRCLKRLLGGFDKLMPPDSVHTFRTMYEYYFCNGWAKPPNILSVGAGIGSRIKQFSSFHKSVLLRDCLKKGGCFGTVIRLARLLVLLAPFCH